METDGNKKVAKSRRVFECISCDYVCSKSSDYIKHLQTKKHVQCAVETDGNQKSPKVAEISHDCIICGRSYKNRSGLWKHGKAGCAPMQPNLEPTSEQDLNDGAVVEILKQHREFKDLIMEQNKQIMDQNRQIMEMSKHQAQITNNNNITNNQFNLQIFLNEKCKDALNITDFVESIQLTLTDLENIGSNGFIEGISNILVKGLKNLDVYKRPIHCSDLKREIMYVKDENSWKKDNEENHKIKNAIKQLAHNNIKQIPVWKEENPECKDSESKKNDLYLKIVNESMGGHTKKEDDDNYEKIIKKVAKETTIDKATTN